MRKPHLLRSFEIYGRHSPARSCWEYRALRQHRLLDPPQLKALDRATLVAFYIRGHSLKQMSRDFETPVGTIKRRLHVARSRLKKALEKQAGKRPRRPGRRDLAGV